MFGQRGKRRLVKTVGHWHRKNRNIRCLYIHFDPQTQDDKVCLFCMNNVAAASESDGTEREEQGVHTAKQTLLCIGTHFNGPGHASKRNLERHNFRTSASVS
jgi:hypothetical protein